jgi:rhomboid protease GluP
VLAAAGIPHRLREDHRGWTVLVPAEAAAPARAALEAYDADAAPPGPEPVAPRPAEIALGIACGAVLVAFFLVTGPPESDTHWFRAGAAAAGAMLHGEPWRAVTALTLHVDLAHVAGNAVATAVLLPGVAARLGPGTGLLLVLLAGSGANLAAAAVHEPRHVAVGASTATFAALGMLAVLRALAPARGPRRRRWAAPIAALVLLALVGVGPSTDVLAHAAGLATGGALALGMRRLGPRAAPVEWALAALAPLAVAGCWWLALAGPPA